MSCEPEDPSLCMGTKLLLENTSHVVAWLVVANHHAAVEGRRTHQNAVAVVETGKHTCWY